MKKSNNAIETLKKELSKDRPKASVSLDKPKRSTGIWFLDVELDGHSVQVQWQAKHGFGVASSASGSYGEGPDEVYDDVEAVRHRVLSLLLSRGETSPPAAVRLAELRSELGLSQIELAKRLNVKQSAISRMERRDDIKISSLRDYCHSLGGDLTLMARFPNGDARIIELEEEEDAKASK